MKHFSGVLNFQRESWRYLQTKQQKPRHSEKVVCCIHMILRVISIPRQMILQLMENVNSSAAEWRLSVSTELQGYNIHGADCESQPKPRSLFNFSQQTIQLKPPWPSFSCNCQAVQVRSALLTGDPPDDYVDTNSSLSSWTRWAASILFQTAHLWVRPLPTPSHLPDELSFTPVWFASSLIGPPVENMYSRIKLRPLPWPSWECYRGWKFLVRQAPSFIEGRSHHPWPILVYWGSLELNLILRSPHTSILDQMRQYEYERRTSLGSVTQISGGHEAVQGTMMRMDISTNWHFLRKEEFERSGIYSHDSMIFGGKEALIARLLTITGSQRQWFSSSSAHIFIEENVPEICNQPTLCARVLHGQRIPVLDAPIHAECVPSCFCATLYSKDLGLHTSARGFLLLPNNNGTSGAWLQREKFQRGRGVTVLATFFEQAPIGHRYYHDFGATATTTTSATTMPTTITTKVSH
ncbi:uncharacterized protein [Triticum aestivum]|uniref:uncharacterized protein n=1 Tax=Triticum aestivum TaxID=4565 RepID=UPI001D030C0A|nr:uncharacterized protein LOC123147510 [Triticum aestivum]